MLVSDLLTLPVSANAIVNITHLPNATSRAIRKARRNLGNARSLLGWETDFELTAEMESSLDAAIECASTRENILRVSTAYESTLRALKQQLRWELGQSKSFLQVIERYRKISVAAEALELDLEVRVETLGNVPYVHDLRLRLAAYQADMALAMQRINGYRQAHRAMIQTSKMTKAKYEQLRIMLRRKLPSDVELNTRQVLSVRLRLKSELDNCPHYQRPAKQPERASTPRRKSRAVQSCCA